MIIIMIYVNLIIFYYSVEVTFHDDNKKINSNEDEKLNKL